MTDGLGNNPMLKKLYEKQHPTNPKQVLDQMNQMVVGKSSTHSQDLPSELWQCVVYYNEEHKVLWKKYYVPLTHVSNEVFFSKKDATIFMSEFIRRLIKKEFLPEEVITDKNELDENKIAIAIAPLTLAMMEKENEAIQ